MEFDTTRSNDRDRRIEKGARRSSGTQPASVGSPQHESPSDARRAHPQPPRSSETDSGTLRIPSGSRKAALVHLGLAAWRRALLDPKLLSEVRHREVDEAGLQRALHRSSMIEIEHVLAPLIRGRHIIVEGRLSGTARTTLERLGAEVEELRLDDEKRYLDMTPAVFVLAAVAMAARYISLGLDDQFMYILAGVGFALMYGLRPFFFKMQRPRD